MADYTWIIERYCKTGKMNDEGFKLFCESTLQTVLYSEQLKPYLTKEQTAILVAWKLTYTKHPGY